MKKNILKFNDLTGMNRDNHPSKEKSGIFYIKNFRIEATDDRALLALVSEKGTEQMSIGINSGEGDSYSKFNFQQGVIIGACTINNYIILFATDYGDDNSDCIFILTDESDNTSFDLLMLSIISGENNMFNFKKEYPIECLTIYENLDIIKVYWTDGLNQPRLMNIVPFIRNTGTPIYLDIFDFVPIIIGEQYNTSITTEKGVGGFFQSGVIQYTYSFYNLFMLETKLVDITPINYITSIEKGEEPNKNINISFKVIINISEDIYNKFDYVRLYSIYRSSLDGTPVVKNITNLSIDTFVEEDGSYSKEFIDNGSSGSVIDNSLLAYIGGSVLSAYTFSDKDNTMFLGNLKTKNNSYNLKINLAPEEIHESFKNVSYINEFTEGKWYPYKNSLHENTSKDIKTFKSREKYILGILFQNKHGEWSDPYPVCLYEIKNTPYFSGVYQDSNNKRIYLPLMSANVSDLIAAILNQNDNNFNSYSDIKEWIDKYEYKCIRPVVSFLKSTEQTRICQGVLSPTVFNYGDRVAGRNYALSSWFFRAEPRLMKDAAVYTDIPINSVDGTMDKWIKDYKYTNWNYTAGKQGATVQWKHFSQLLPSDTIGAELLNMYNDDYKAFTIDGSKKRKSALPMYANDWENESMAARVFLHATSITDQLAKHTESPQYGNDISMFFDAYKKENYDSFFFTDRSIVTFNSPDLEFNQNLQSIDYTNLKLNIVGYIPIHSVSGSYYINATPPSAKRNGIKGALSGILSTGFLKYPIKRNVSYHYFDGHFGILSAQSCWSDTIQNVRIGGGYEDDQSSEPTEDQLLFAYSPDEFEHSFVVYPWQRQYLNNFSGNTRTHNSIWQHEKPSSGSGWYVKNLYSTKDPESSKIIRKVLSNLRYSQNTVFFSNEKTTPDDNIIKFWESSRELPILINNLEYTGTVDKLISSASSTYIPMKMELRSDYVEDGINQIGLENGYPIIMGNKGINYGINNSVYNGLFYPLYYEPGLVDYLNLLNNYVLENNSEDTELPIPASMPSFHAFNPNDSCCSLDSITMRYKSSNHLVVKFGKEKLTFLNDNNELVTQDVQYTLPYKTLPSRFVPPFEYDNYYDKLQPSYIATINGTYSDMYSTKFIVKQNLVSFTVDTDYYEEKYIDIKNGIPLPSFSLEALLEYEDKRDILWIGEIVNENAANGIDIYSQDRSWYPSGDRVNIEDIFQNGEVQTNKQITWTEGDTYFLRYDCLKTYSYSIDDYLSVNEIVSFMCETRVNLDGRYDDNRRLLDNTYVTNENFNKLNDVYNQNNNIFSYRIPLYYMSDIIDYPNYVTWGLEKISGEDVDTWSSIFLSNTLEMDGNKGEIRKLERFSNILFCFQDSGVSQINYNENAAISTDKGMPLEIACSKKVSGKQYISETLGCSNKWTVCKTPNGLYFVDNLNYDIMLFNGKQMVSLTDNLGLHTWLQDYLNNNTIQQQFKFEIDNSTRDIYFTGMVVYYDKINENVYFCTRKQCLAYSEKFKKFTSFYSYENTPFFIFALNTGYMIHSTSSTPYIYKYQNGFSNIFFENYESSEITLKASPDNIYGDCIFDHVLYQADVFKSAPFIRNNSWFLPDIYPNESFSTIKVLNDYQNSGDVQLNMIGSVGSESIHSTSNLKKKFRIWRAALPRINGRLRIRNPWTFINLKWNQLQQRPLGGIALHDINVVFYN